MQYQCEILDGVMIARVAEQKLVIDTGAPLSFANGPVALMQQSFDVGRNYMGIDADYLSAKLGAQVDGILGADILGRFCFVVDHAGATVDFAASPPAAAGEPVPLGSAMGLPYLIDVECMGKTHCCYLDTGASMTYLSAVDYGESEPVGHYDDFNPMLGDFSTDVHACTARVAGREFPVRAGRLPESADLLLGMLGVTGILGADLFKAFRVTFEPDASRLFLEAY